METGFDSFEFADQCFDFGSHVYSSYPGWPSRVASVVEPGAYPDRASWDSALRGTIEAFAPDWVVSAGFMRLLGDSVLEAFPGRIINTHPALLPSFPGVRGVADALTYGVKVTGCTVKGKKATLTVEPAAGGAVASLSGGKSAGLNTVTWNGRNRGPAGICGLNRGPAV